MSVKKSQAAVLLKCKVVALGKYIQIVTLLQAILQYIGRDGTSAFLGAGHSKTAFKLREKYHIGRVTKSDEIRL